MSTAVTGRLFVVGDIHGCPVELEALLSCLDLAVEDRVIFLGDYIDRGPSAREVVGVLVDLARRRPCGLTFLKGNHEDMLLDYLGHEGNFGESFLINGGDATLESYGCRQSADPAEVVEALPHDHLQFFLDLELSHPAGNVLCVHAGINPTRSLEDQEAEDLLWIRQEFIHHRHALPYTVVYGHTPRSEVLFDLPYKVGIDTGLVYGGKLSCLELSRKCLFQIARGSRDVKVCDARALWQVGERRASA